MLVGISSGKDLSLAAQGVVTDQQYHLGICHRLVDPTSDLLYWTVHFNKIFR
jgi:hypothetical protein